MSRSTLELFDLAKKKGDESAQPELLDHAVIALVLASEEMSKQLDAEEFPRLERPSIMSQLAISFCERRRRMAREKKEGI